MTFTSNCDFYVAIQDAGINRAVRHVMKQRPSLFNYGTALLVEEPRLLCSPVDVDPRVTAADNPMVTVLPPLPVLMSPYRMNYAVQLADFGQVDFAPSNVITLPSALNPPLPDQRLAVHLQVCGGLGCPGSEETPGVAPIDEQGVTVLPTQQLDCFCLDLFATAGCGIHTGSTGNQTIRPTVDGIFIGGLQPAGLEESIVCYAKTALDSGFLPLVGQIVSPIAFGLLTIPQTTTGNIQVSGDIQVSASTTVPNNPAIQDDQLEAFIDLDKIDLNITTGGGIGGPGSSGGTVTRTTRPRTRTGTFDLTAAVSADAFTKIFGAFMKGFRFNESGSGSYGPFSVSYDVAAHLEAGSIKLLNTGGIELRDLVIKWDTLSLTFGVTLPNVCTPGFCLVPNPFDGCAVYISPKCVWSTPPTISFTIDLGGLLDSKVTVTGNPKVFYGVGSGVTNRWQIAVEPVLPILIDIIDLADAASSLFQTLITNAIDSLISGLPQWAQDLINAILGSIDDIITTVLGIPDDIVEWLMDVISNLGIYQDLADALAQYISITIFEVDDPFLVLPPQGALIPVMLPIDYLGISVNSNEMVVQGDMGD